MRLVRLPVMLAFGAALSGCSMEALSPTDEEVSLCVKAILEYGSVGVLGDEYGYNVHSGTDGRSVQLNYPETEVRPGFACVVFDGKLVEAARIERIYPATGVEL
ncbi:hypothetical protein [Hoeflea sp.]|uniref:hypothetical protein n=1 Tax=Hoeflea sp. TaxID=1940281 RepID=UPI00374A64BA